MAIFIPGINELENKLFEIQVYGYEGDESSLLITGPVDWEFEQGVYLSLSLLRKKGYKVPSYLHIHVADYNCVKSGISSSLGSYLTLKYYIEKKKLSKDYVVSGELDLDGNINEIGGVREKINAFRKCGKDYMIYAGEEVEKNTRIITVHNLYECENIIEGIEHEIE